ncbi:class F sortase [Streptomyces ipomoeae]|uniref:Sortase family protein n=2 Tax=Streptomyces ipomoeae TaxID=103232 RepID=L1L1C7_9ACTN|nr:class F sortase [Streptomyces ipomoeae]EKX66500.1 sortase family protein [Streptomyces ipomoeae 91-03]MDX2700013.1 class F sortase [Streptomyces ipomoeae]MDX2822255.1 class F sortase [Streptomyces ipomoeae]MDX2840597.1 class F sortase [Streptomyces ipomoeae]MDX2874778.1 class F sortase [Streptomyces ipomoeae]
MFSSKAAEVEWEMRRRKRAPWGVIALVLLTGLALIQNGSGEFDVGPPQPASAAAADGRGIPHGTFTNVPDPLPYAMVDRVRIPSIRVDAPVVPVGLDTHGWVDAPPAQDPNLAGWFTGAVSPGEQGTAVIVGHVDNHQGPAVFYGLGALKKGSQVEIQRGDGKTAVFEIYGIEVFEKNNFPGDRVYGNSGIPELRVITCGGGFSQQNGYDGNVVVFARLVEVR